MKSTIIFLGLAVLNFTTGIAANELRTQDLIQQEVVMVSADSAQCTNLLMASGTEQFKSKWDTIGEDTTIFNPNSVIQSTYVKTVTDVINENKLVTESSNDLYQPVVLEMTLEDKIAENNQIIESVADANFYPLDYEKINRSDKITQVKNNCVAVPVEIKL